VQPATVTFRFGGDFTLCEFTVSADHKYSHFGVYTTTVSVSGGPLGHSGSDQGEITVADVNIAGAFVPFAATAGTAFNGVVASFKDANPLSQPGDFTSSIDWGDGSPVITGTIAGSNGVFTVAGAHTYAAAGTYTVRSTLQHPTGPPAVAVGTVTVGGAPPAGGGGGGPVASPLPTMRLAHASLSARALRVQGLAMRLSTGAASGRTLRLEVLRNGRHFANSTLRLQRTDGRVQTVRWRPSAAQLGRLRPGAYALRIRVGKPVQTLTRPFRVSRAQR